MCKTGNQTIYEICALKLKNMGIHTNREMHEALAKTEDGCMFKDRELDSKGTLVLR